MQSLPLGIQKPVFIIGGTIIFNVKTDWMLELFKFVSPIIKGFNFKAPDTVYFGDILVYLFDFEIF